MIPVCTPLLGEKETQYVMDCLSANWISSGGKYIREFEETFSRYCGAGEGISTTSGTSALHLALAALNLKPRDEVIMPAFTIASTAFAAMYCGARPVFVDSERGTWNIDVQKIEKKITRRTKVILPVHMYGHPCDMGPIMRLARKYRLTVVEDAAEAHAAEYHGQKAGGIGHVGCFSFYANKVITTGEGGMVVTSDKKIAQRCRKLKNLAFEEQKRFWHKECGFNYRMTNIQAAIGLAQMERIDEFVERRRYNASLYTALLSGIGGLTLPEEREGVKSNYWMYALLVEKSFGMSRDKLMEKLRAQGIETRTFFIPMHQQPVIRRMGFVRAGERYPVAEDIGRRGFYLPSGTGLTSEEIECVCAAIKKIQKSA